MQPKDRGRGEQGGVALAATYASREALYGPVAFFRFAAAVT